MTQSIWTEGWFFPLLLLIAKSLLVLVVLLTYVAFALLADRKIWAAVQLRRGPNVVGPFGLLQSFADLLKFVLKEPVIPSGASKAVFLLAPILTATLSLAAWAVVPVADGWAVADLNVGILYVFAISSLGVYGVIMGGWASNSKYPFLGALRSAAQMVSYEVSIGFVIITVLLCAGSLNLNDIIKAQDTKYGLFGWYWLPLFPMFVIFFISALAETNRPPFDLPEAESELNMGYHQEYSSMKLGFYLFSEYVNMFISSAVIATLFFGGYDVPFLDESLLSPNVAALVGIIALMAKVIFFIFLFMWVRWTIPRFRYDQLMNLGWKKLLPLAIANMLITAVVILWRSK